MKRRAFAVILVLGILFGCMPAAGAAGEAFEALSPPGATIEFTAGMDGIDIDDFSKIEKDIPGGVGLETAAITITCNLTTPEDWAAALEASGSNTGINAWLDLTLASVKKLGATGDETGTLESLMNEVSYGEENSSAPQENLLYSIPLASVHEADGYATITPQRSFASRWLVKYVDGNDQEHFYCINYRLIQSSNAAVRIPVNHVDSGRVTPNCDNLNYVSGGYGDGTVTYRITGTPTSTGVISIGTGITVPAGAAQVQVNGGTAQTVTPGNQYRIGTGFDTGNPRMETSSVTLIWLDGEGNPFQKDKLSVKIIPEYMGSWMTGENGQWIPAGTSSVGAAYAASHDPHLNYDETSGQWTFDLNASAGVDAEALSDGGSRVLFIDAPDGAAKYRIATHWGAAIYSDRMAEAVQTELANSDFYPLDGSDSGLWHYGTADGVYVTFGSYCTLHNLAGTPLQVLAAAATEEGYADSAHIQWYDADDSLIRVGGSGDKDGEFIYLIIEPYLKTLDTETQTTEPTQEVQKPTMVHSGGGRLKGGEYWYRQIRDDGRQYWCIDLKFLDEQDNPRHPGGPVDIFLPYPAGTSYADFSGQYPRLLHFENGLDGSGRNVTMEYLPVGIKFSTSTFSAFVLSWGADDTAAAPESGSGGGPVRDPAPGIEYLGMGEFISRNVNAAPTAVLVDGAPVDFTGNAEGFALDLSGFSPGRHSITVKWGSRSLRSYFDYEGGAGMAVGIPDVLVTDVPKTGEDGSRIGFAMVMLGAIVLWRRRSKA